MPFYHPNLRYFSFFRNKEIDALYLTTALIGFTGSLAGIFAPVYFWELGMPLWRILYFFLINSIYFLLFAFLLIPAMKKTSDKSLMLVSVPFIALYYLGLNFFSEYPVLFYILPIIHSVSALLFSMGYHTDFSGSADGDSLGRELGTRSLITSLANLSAPFLGGLIIASFGFGNVFLLSTAILLLAVFPLFYFPKRNLSPDLSSGSIIKYLKAKDLIPFSISGMGYAAETMVGTIVWPVFLFLVLEESIGSLGGVFSLGLLAGAVIAFVMGFLSDAGKRRGVLLWSAVISAGIWIARLFLKTGFGFAASQIAGQAAGSSLIVAWSAQYYKIARALPSGTSFILSRDILYHIVRVPFLAFLMLLSYYLPLSAFFSFSFLIAAATTILFVFANKTHTRVVASMFASPKKNAGTSRS